MSLIRLVDCENKDQFTVDSIWQGLLAIDQATGLPKIRTISDADIDVISPIDCENKDQWTELTILLNVVLLGDDNLLYLNIT